MIIIFDEKFKKLLDDNSWTENYTKKEVEKLKQAIEVHGYRGASKKKHNGIVPIRPSDSNLISTLKKLTDQLEQDIKVKCSNAIPIKVVAHVPSGWRMIGYKFNQEINGEIISKDVVLILGMANYE